MHNLKFSVVKKKINWSNNFGTFNYFSIDKIISYFFLFENWMDAFQQSFDALKRSLLPESPQHEDFMANKFGYNLNSFVDEFRLSFILSSKISTRDIIECAPGSAATFSDYIREELEYLSMLKLTRVFDQRFGLLKVLMNLKARNRNQHSIVSSKCAECSRICEGMSASNQRRTMFLNSSTERKIRELIFEVIGEYAKSQLRATRLKENLGERSRLSHFWAVSRLRWQKFSLRLCFEASVLYPKYYPEQSQPFQCALQSEVLCGIKDFIEIELVREKILDKLGTTRPDTRKLITAVLRFVKHSTDQNGKIISLSKNMHPAPLCAGRERKRLYEASTLEEVANFSQILNHWLKMGQRPSTTNSRRCGHATKSTSSSGCEILSLVSGHYIAWMHPPSFLESHFARIRQVDNFHCKNEFRNDVDHIQQDFVQRFADIHSAEVVSDRFYLCLEERFQFDWRSVEKSQFVDSKNKKLDAEVDLFLEASIVLQVSINIMF